MATSTEETIRDAIVEALQAIAVSDLGFDQPEGNIKDYLLDYEREENVTDYLMALVDGEPEVRCWAVDVIGDDDWYATGNVTLRQYQITITGYYEKGTEGAGVKELVRAARKVRGAIRGMNSTLGNRVDLIRDTSALNRQTVKGLDPDYGEILSGTMIYIAERRQPDF